MSETVSAVDNEKIEKLRMAAFELTPHEQYRLAWFIAENINYILSSRDLPDDLAHALSREAALVALAPAFEDEAKAIRSGVSGGDGSEPGWVTARTLDYAAAKIRALAQSQERTSEGANDGRS